MVFKSLGMNSLLKNKENSSYFPIIIRFKIVDMKLNVKDIFLKIIK